MTPEQERWFVGFYGAKDCYHVVAGPFVEKSVANVMARIMPAVTHIVNTHTVIPESEALAADLESTNSLIEQSK